MSRYAPDLRVEAPEALFGECEEDIVLARELAVNRGGAVFDALGNLADGDVAVALRDEQVARCFQDGVSNGLTLAILTFSDAHVYASPLPWSEQCSVN